MTIETTPSQTIGPFHAVLMTLGSNELVPQASPGAITIAGTVYDGAGAIVPDALLEIWQANADGIYAHPEDPRWQANGSTDAFAGFGRCATRPDGSYSFLTLKPGRVPGADERMQAPHIVMNVFARGLLNRLVTRIYFEDEPAANASDPLLTSIETPAIRQTMVARLESPSNYRFDIRLQGENETAFLAV